ncbi:MAG: hypothetical protein IKJ32_03750 [Clostridia bacterium]|nr:hypothetical protein [Clostridia bacterium]
MIQRTSSKKLFGFVLAIMMLMVPNLVLAGTSAQIQPRWACILSIGHLLERVEDERALSLYAETETYSGYYAAVEAQLQKYNSSTRRWDNVNEVYWDYADESEYCYIDATYISVPSGTYRFDLTFVAYSTSWVELESFSCYTDQVTIP